MSVIGSPWIVGHHDDGLLELVIEALHQPEDGFGGLGVQVTGRLIREEHRRIRDDRPRDRYALLLASGELTRIVIAPVGEADDVENRLDLRPPIG
jgi:hypothetical protein